MGDIVQFDGGIDPQKQELLDYLAELRREIAQLDENEPEEQESEQFEIWSAGRHFSFSYCGRSGHIIEQQ